MTKDFFAKKAGDYDKGSHRVANVQAIVNAILEAVPLNQDMHLMDFGAGTGLLLEGIASHVGKITAVDISPSMIAELKKKQINVACDLQIVQADLTDNKAVTTYPLGEFDGIISSMTLHHIEDIPGMFTTFKRLLKTGGFIALADLDTEDGSFHSEDTGVFHHGFDSDYLLKVAKETGFTDVKIAIINAFEKNDKKYPVFLLVAKG